MARSAREAAHTVRLTSSSAPAILHHLNLPRAAAEVGRVLRPGGGRAVFQEPVRNSAFLRWARRLIPYRGADVSPFEQWPLLDDGFAGFAAGARLSVGRSRTFMLPRMCSWRRSFPACRGGSSRSTASTRPSCGASRPRSGLRPCVS